LASSGREKNVYARGKFEMKNSGKFPFLIFELTIFVFEIFFCHTTRGKWKKLKKTILKFGLNFEKFEICHEILK
jgi:hypothetical protein